ncbi:MAG: four helix bundle protein [Bacteroidota bacterium]
MSYTKLLIWQQAKELSVAIHKMTLSLPKFEQFEEAQQIRRSSKSIRSNIVEGYGRRRYKHDFIKFLIYALSSCDETLDHLDILFETESLKDEASYKCIREQTDKLGRHINKFLSVVEKNHNTFEP